MKKIAIALVALFALTATADAAGWAAVKWAQCIRLGGTYCR